MIAMQKAIHFIIKNWLNNDIIFGSFLKNLLFGAGRIGADGQISSAGNKGGQDFAGPQLNNIGIDMRIVFLQRLN